MSIHLNLPAPGETLIKSTTDWQFRAIGVLPALIFAYRLIQYIDAGNPDWIMYNCNVTLLMLSLGMIFRWELAVRVATIWLAIGVPMWLIDAWVTQILWPASILSHLGGFLLALYAIRRVRATGRSWAPAAAWFLFWQMVTRLTTAPELNVNIAHSPYEFTRTWFPGYWSFWPVCALAVTILSWLAETSLARNFPFTPNAIVPEGNRG